MPKSFHWRFAVVVAAALCISSSTVAASRTATQLVPAAAARLSAEALAALCSHLSSPCAPASIRVMVAAPMPQGQLWLLDSARPWLAALDEHAPADASRASVWDFSGYVHSVPPQSDRGGTPNGLSVYPAIYPSGSSGRAVALVSSSSEMYSGGGASFDTADFVELAPASQSADPSLHVVYAGVPFACSKIVRACFSEQEYRHSPHCHDDSTGYLTIEFGDGAAPRGWTFRWHERYWPSGEPKSRQRSTRSVFKVRAGPRVVSAGAPVPGAPFCGGPAS